MNGLTMELELSKYTGWSIEEVQRKILEVASEIPESYARVRHFLSLAVPMLGWGDAVEIIRASPFDSQTWYGALDVYRGSLCFGSAKDLLEAAR